MNKGSVLHPRLFEQNKRLWDRKVELQSFTEVFDPVQQSQKTYGPAAGVPQFIDCRRGVFTAALAQSAEMRGAEITVSVDSEYIALKGYYPQIRKEWRAQLVGGQAWDILGVIFDSTRTQTYLIVELVTE